MCPTMSQKIASKNQRPASTPGGVCAPCTHISEPAIATCRALRGFGPAQEHRPERPQGGAVAGQASTGCLTAATNGRDFVALLEAFRATGGTAPIEIVGCLLREHQIGNAVSLARLIHTGQAFGFEWRDSLWIPMFQFDANDLALKVSAQRVRAVLPSLCSGWDVANWFATPNVRLDGHAPAEMLDLDVASVIRAAGLLKAVDQFSVPLVRRAREVAAHV